MKQQNDKKQNLWAQNTIKIEEEHIYSINSKRIMIMILEMIQI